MATSNLTTRLAAAEAEICDAILQCMRQLRSLPQNPAAKQLSDKSPRAMVLSSSAIFNSPTMRMDVFFHDWQAQYDAIAKLLEKRNFSRVRELLQGRPVEVPGHGRTSLAPEVIANVKAITGELLLLDDGPDAARK